MTQVVLEWVFAQGDEEHDQMDYAVHQLLNPKSQVRDQVIEKCRSHRLRTRRLEKDQGLTLDDVRTIAKTLEMAESILSKWRVQMGMVTTHQVVTEVSVELIKENQHNLDRTNQGHFGKDPSFPAQGKICNKCGKSGHFGTMCKTKQEGQQNQRRFDKYGHKSAKAIVNYVASDDNDEYPFIVKN
ncbi:unnamed protein product [Mytilus coruscus]|uniref:CCHC-type domain-containing protein n=1 Tax=Mytilus coruscus TaxID=42192 RepID=A0A6J8DH05_MYTCO|nr:unnamed protein product [Mytilus coruscus]